MQGSAGWHSTHLDLGRALGPGRLPGRHLQDCAPQGPDVSRNTVALLPDHLGSL
jgi:hypothetical protein